MATTNQKKVSFERWKNISSNYVFQNEMKGKSEKDEMKIDHLQSGHAIEQPQQKTNSASKINEYHF